MGAQQAPPGVRSELALITNQEITAWGWGVGERQKEGGGGGREREHHQLQAPATLASD